MVNPYVETITTFNSNMNIDNFENSSTEFLYFTC